MGKVKFSTGLGREDIKATVEDRVGEYCGLIRMKTEAGFLLIILKRHGDSYMLSKAFLDSELNQVECQNNAIFILDTNNMPSYDGMDEAVKTIVNWYYQDCVSK
ncbi:MAG: hypothetical protein Q8P68_05045 [Candidatus Peregrinibacteria bacterium]|nr:hypothetical protein [Candidatus Peregrinibacteria bacterium]MDZ4244482.1 hypothetical protein [Candidatus Gracilibacteria bacterium]